jgi:hypothetical protein
MFPAMLRAMLMAPRSRPELFAYQFVVQAEPRG